jgi:hypothetical protein
MEVVWSRFTLWFQARACQRSSAMEPILRRPMHRASSKSKGREDAMKIKTDVKAGTAPVEETIHFNFGGTSPA